MSKKVKFNKIGLRLATASAAAMLAVSLGGTSAYADECVLVDDPGDFFTSAVAGLEAVNNSSGTNSTACGISADSVGNQASAYGFRAAASGTSSTAVGNASAASGASSIAVGTQSSATATSSTAVGNAAAASGVSSSAYGHNSVAAGVFSTAVGRLSEANGISATAVGNNAQTVVGSDNGTAIGTSSIATTEASALGLSLIHI